jgi:hypothetical protein
MVNVIKADGPKDSWSLKRRVKITTKAPAAKIWQLFQFSSDLSLN